MFSSNTSHTNLLFKDQAMKYLRPLLYGFLLLSIISCKEKDPIRPALAEQVVIHRDTWGIPHVVGETDAAAVFGLAYAYAEDQFPLIEKNTLIAIGRYCEAFGVEDTAMYYSDFKNKVYEVEKMAKVQYRNLDEKTLGIANAFAEGLNYYLETHPEEPVKLLKHFEPWQIIAGDIHSALDIKHDSYNYGMDMPGAVTAMRNNRRQVRGSNGWALAPKKTASGNTMLLMNTHDPHQDTYYECHIMSKEGLNFYGVMSYFKISALPMTGFNENLGFTVTLNRRDMADAYTMQFDHPEDSLMYRFGAEYKKAEILNFDLTFKDSTNLKKESFQVLKTIHGPVLQDGSGNLISYRMIDQRESILLQKYGMLKASNHQEWMEAVQRNAKAEHNLTYADRYGNIHYIFGGRTPKRDPSYDWSNPVDGSDPGTLWKGYHDISEMPQLFNPEPGYVQNCNQSPFLTTHSVNPNPEDFPEYMWKLNDHDNPRAKRSRELLSSSKDVTLESFHQMNFDTKIANAEPYIQSLIKEWDDLKSSEPDVYNKLEGPIREFRNWDLQSHPESIATTLYVVWGDMYNLHGFEDVNNELISYFDLAVKELEQQFGTWKVPYKNLIRVQRTPEYAYSFDPEIPSYPTSGNGSWFGTMFCMGFAYYDGENLVRKVEEGNSFVAHIEFTPEGPIANSLLSYGNSSRQDSPHYNDQTEMFARGKMKKVNFTMEDIRNNLETQYRPGE